jgi:hypothetical protein
MNKICPTIQGANEVNAHVYIQTDRQTDNIPKTLFWTLGGLKHVNPSKPQVNAG